MAQVKGKVVVDTVTGAVVLELPERAAAWLVREGDFDRSPGADGVVGTYRGIPVVLRRPQAIP